MKMPRLRPPTSASGKLTSRPTAAAAIAITTRLKKFSAASVLNVGAMSTPANPANRLDSAQLKADTRSAKIPFSSVIRGLSTTARMRRPIDVYLNRSPRMAIAETATTMATSSSRLKR